MKRLRVGMYGAPFFLDLVMEQSASFETCVCAFGLCRRRAAPPMFRSRLLICALDAALAALELAQSNSLETSSAKKRLCYLHDKDAQTFLYKLTHVYQSFTTMFIHEYTNTRGLWLRKVTNAAVDVRERLGRCVRTSNQKRARRAWSATSEHGVCFP